MNVSVNSHNNNICISMNTDKGQIKAVDIVTGDISDDLKKQMRAKVPDDPTKTMSLIYSLVQRATTAKCDLTTNIDVTDGLTSGAECIIESIGNSSRPSITWVSFSDPSIGSQENCHLYHKENMKKKTGHQFWRSLDNSGLTRKVK